MHAKQERKGFSQGSHLLPLAPLCQLPAPKPVVIIISGPSGVGKDAVVQKLKETRSDLYFVVTATSRYA